MNYGEKFVDSFNEKFEEICSHAKETFESYYDTSYSFRKVELMIVNSLGDEKRKIEKSIGLNQEVFDKCHNHLNWFTANYTSDVSVSLINDEVREEFLRQIKKESESVNYSKFIDLFSKWEAIRRYTIFVKENNSELAKKFKSKKIGDFLSVVKTKRELHSLQNLKKPKKEIEGASYDLTQNEKMILLHVLMHRFVKEDCENKSTQYFRILSLTSGCLIEDDVNNAKTNNNKYNYFLSGVLTSNKSDNDKGKMIDDILTKIKDVKNINDFKRSLKMYKMRYKNH